MAQYTTEAIILGVKNWGEADKLLWFFSREQGKLRAVAYGARRARSLLAGPLQPFNLVSVTLSEGDRLDIVRQCSVGKRYRKLTEDLTAMAYASFVAELTLELCPEHEPQPELYDELGKIFVAFEKRNPRLVALSAAYKLFQIEGLALSSQNCVHCGSELVGDGWFDVKEGGALCEECTSGAAMEYRAGTRELIHLLETVDLEKDETFSIKGADLNAAEVIMLSYLAEITEKPLKSLSFIAQLN